MTVSPSGAVVEIIERGATVDRANSAGVVVPNEIRLNGVPMYAPADRPVTVHQVDMAGNELACVTLTLFARRVLIGAEGDINAQPALCGQGYFFAERDDTNPAYPIRIQRRTALDGQGAILDTHGISVEQAEALIGQLKAALTQSAQDDVHV